MAVKQLIDVNDFPFDKKTDKTKYMYHQPSIKPNYGKAKRSILPKTRVCNVLLYENKMQRKTLSIKTRYFSHQQRGVQCMYEKTRHTFTDQIRSKQHHHDVWDSRYQHMKDAYIAEFGTTYMPSGAGEENADEYKLLTYANLAPPINVLCYFLASGLDPRQRAVEKRLRVKKKIEGMTKDPLHQYLNRRGHPVRNFQKDDNQTKVCSKDKRFRTLTESLSDPGFESDGYIQISPGYAKGKPSRRKLWGKPRAIALPGFYARAKMEREGSPCSHHSKLDENMSASIYEDDRTSVSSLI